MSLEILSTARLRLRPFRPDDLPDYLAYRNDPAVMRYQSWETPLSEAEGRDFLAEMATARPGGPGGVQIAVALAASDRLVGDLYLGPHMGDGRQGSVGYSIAPQHQGQGYASEALAALLGYAFGSLGLHRVAATVDPRNGPSVRVLERVGMRREGHLVQSYWERGGWTDEYLYALLREEWLRRGVGDGQA